MDRISILDCTLRDGGYVNNFSFGKKTIKKIIAKLSKAAIDIIECGFLSDCQYNSDKTLFSDVEQIRELIDEKNENLLYVAMIQVGLYDPNNLPGFNGKGIDGIRLTFHEHELEKAIYDARLIMEKGYKVFVQPVGTTTYPDDILLKLIDKVNDLQPYAFYLVDTLGVLYKNDLLRLFYLIDHNLNRDIYLGFHSHNNLQMSFANAQELMQLNSSRKIILDTSVYGLGRGAGNLNTELVTQYINTNFILKYDNIEILEIIDEYIKPLKISYKWGYDAAYYLAAIFNCHPNYASFLLNKQTVHIQDINHILKNMSYDKRALYDEKYISEMYTDYLGKHVNDESVLAKLSEELKNRDVILIAPGSSASKYIENICERKNSGSFIICINFNPSEYQADMIFVSNMKRFGAIANIDRIAATVKVVVTSNIPINAVSQISVVDYRGLNNESPTIVDNAGLMCVNLMNKIGLKKISLIGFDGYTGDIKNNYYDRSMSFNVDQHNLEEMNIETVKKFNQIKSQMKVEFISPSIYSER